MVNFAVFLRLSGIKELFLNFTPVSEANLVKYALMTSFEEQKRLQWDVLVCASMREDVWKERTGRVCFLFFVKQRANNFFFVCWLHSEPKQTRFANVFFFFYRNLIGRKKKFIPIGKF